MPTNATLLIDYNQRLNDKNIQVVIVQGGKEFGGAPHYELRRDGGEYRVLRLLNPLQFPINSDATIVPDAIMVLVANSAGLPRR